MLNIKPNIIEMSILHFVFACTDCQTSYSWLYPPEWKKLLRLTQEDPAGQWHNPDITSEYNIPSFSLWSGKDSKNSYIAQKGK